MSDETFQVRFRGVRGSVPVSGEEYRRYGGNTCCLELTMGAHTIFLDAGSGIRPAGKALAKARIEETHIFLTHSHYDHVIGIPFFYPLYDPSTKVVLWSGHMAGKMTTRQLLEDFMRPPWFPVAVELCASNLECRDFRSGDVLAPFEGVQLKTYSMNHPGGCIGYRVEWQGKSVALVTDTEHVPGELDPIVLEQIANADLVIYDATYTEAEMARFKGFGHSSWQQAILLCEAARARKLALFHHDPTRTDEQLGAIEHDAQAAFAGAFAARDGMVLEI